MKITNIPRQLAETWQPADFTTHRIQPTIVISICDDPADPLQLSPHLQQLSPSIIRLYFLDIEDPSSEQAPTPAHAERILCALKNAETHQQDVLVHCTVGANRSGTVVSFAHEYFDATTPLNLSQGDNSLLSQLLRQAIQPRSRR